MDRRSYIRTTAAFSTLAVAGCIGGGGGGDSSDDSGNSGGMDTGGSGQSDDADDDGIPDSRDDYPNDSRWSQKDEQEGRISVNEDEWYLWEFGPSTEVGISYEMAVREGPAVDVILFSDSEYTYYENEERAKYYSAASDLDTTLARADTTLSAGDYVLVVDNTNYGDAAPPTDFDDSIADVEYRLTLKA